MENKKLNTATIEFVESNPSKSENTNMLINSVDLNEYTTAEDILAKMVETEETIAEGLANKYADKRFDVFKAVVLETLAELITNNGALNLLIRADISLDNVTFEIENHNKKVIKLNEEITSLTFLYPYVIRRVKYEKKVEALIEGFGFEKRGGSYIKEIKSTQILRK